MNKNIMREIVSCVVEAADELAEKPRLDPLEQGQLLAYAETLCMIQDACAGCDLSEIGLDFDVDARYLFDLK